jgi:hypothetical protein
MEGARMELLLLLVNIASGAGGFYVAWLWRKSASSGVRPSWTVEPADPSASASGWVGGLLSATQESAAPNRRAALWTAISVALTALASCIGAVS